MDFVIHELLKDVNGPVRDRYRNSVIAPTAEETSFVSEVRRLFQRHHSGRIYGNFEPDSKKYPFSGMLRDYQSKEDFLAFSKQAAGHLAKTMAGITVATGGYFFAARFAEGDQNLLLIFMLSQRQSHAVDEKTLSLRRSVSLQMEHLDLAARISITDWEAGRPEPVSLVRGRKEVSDYFKTFIGLYEPRTNTEVTQKLKQITEKWMDKRKYPEPQRADVRARVVEYAKKRGNEPVELEVVATIVDEDRHEKFFNAANEQRLGAEFYVDRVSLRAWERVDYSDADLRLNFSKRLLLTGRINYNADEKTLLIHPIELPKEALR